MFGFFRRQNNKKSTSSKNQKQRSNNGTIFVGHIQCVPVDKCEIGNLQQVLAVKPPTTSTISKVQQLANVPNWHKSAMGNSESNPIKKIEEQRETNNLLIKNENGVCDQMSTQSDVCLIEDIDNSVEKLSDDSDAQSEKAISTQRFKMSENRADTITRRWRDTISSIDDDEDDKGDENKETTDKNVITNTKSDQVESLKSSGNEKIKNARDEFFKIDSQRNGGDNFTLNSSATNRAINVDPIEDRYRGQKPSWLADPECDDDNLSSDQHSEIRITSDEEEEEDDDEVEEEEEDEDEDRFEETTTTADGRIDISAKFTDTNEKAAFCIPNDLDAYRNSKIITVKNNANRIPDILITESSDSEGENEEISEYDLRDIEDDYLQQERPFHSVLYNISEVDEYFTDASDVDLSDTIAQEKRNIVHQESKFHDQIKTLKCEIENKDVENMQLQGKVNDLQRDVATKNGGMDRLRAELASFQIEAECVRKKLFKVEEDLMKYKSKNSELNEQLMKNIGNENNSKKMASLQNEIEKLKIKIKELQNELDATKKERDDAQMKINKNDKEMKEKLEKMETTLNEVLKENERLKDNFLNEYEKLRTLNSDREQQLLNDFEWKLREVELKCKRKLEQKDIANEEKIQSIRDQRDNELKRFEAQFKEIEKLKSYEAEVNQLRGLLQEQERSLRIAAKSTEQWQINERSLNDEIERLRSTLEKERNHLATVQGIHSREISEKDRKLSFKLEQQKNEFISQWEDKIRRETIRLKLELEKKYKDEKRSMLDEAKTKADQQLKENEEEWQKKLSECRKQLEIVEQKLAKEEESCRNERLTLQTNSDCQMMELRRKLDKMDLSYQEKLEKQQERHEKEIEILREEYEKKIQQNEQNWSQQISSTRATLELVKEQLQREAENQLQHLHKKYSLQLEDERHEFIRQKEEIVSQLQGKYNDELDKLQKIFDEEKEEFYRKEKEQTTVIENLVQNQLENKSDNEQSLPITLQTLQTTISALQEKILNYEKLNEEIQTKHSEQEAEHAAAVASLKEDFENELSHWKSKLNLDTKIQCDKLEERQNASNTNQQTRSRRRGRGKHRNKNNANPIPQLAKQFSSSSL